MPRRDAVAAAKAAAEGEGEPPAEGGVLPAPPVPAPPSSSLRARLLGAVGPGVSREVAMLWVECVGVVSGVAVTLVAQMDARQPRPYMDEVFHVPQAQRFCEGNFYDYDPKITTPPGLYGLTWLAVRAAAWLSGRPAAAFCSPFYLRLSSAFLATVNFGLLTALSWRLHGPAARQGKPISSITAGKLVIGALNMSLLPVLFFFCMLYYTEQASLAALLLTWLCHAYGWRVVGCVAAVGALATRQTNVVWLVWLLGQDLVVELSAALGDADTTTKQPITVSGDHQTSPTGESTLINSDHRHDDKVEAKQQQQEAEEPQSLLATLMDVARLGPTRLIIAIGRVLARQPGLVAAILIFVAAVAYNGGAVALGDREAHTAAPHLPQLAYFAAFTAATLWPQLLARATVILPRWRQIDNRRRLWLPLLTRWLALSVAFAVAVYVGHTEHPYLLADNRHYTFYVWRRVFHWHWTVRYALCPLYAAATLCLWRALNGIQLSRPLPAGAAVSPATSGANGAAAANLWRLGWLACTALALVPAPLIEPRYFIAPWLAYRLYLSRVTCHGGWLPLMAETATYVAVNAATVYVFFTRTFTWPDTDAVQRFMW